LAWGKLVSGADRNVQMHERNVRNPIGATRPATGTGDSRQNHIH
jgi:hypothetical protein